MSDLKNIAKIFGNPLYYLWVVLLSVFACMKQIIGCKEADSLTRKYPRLMYCRVVFVQGDRGFSFVGVDILMGDTIHENSYLPFGICIKNTKRTIEIVKEKKGRNAPLDS